MVDSDGRLLTDNREIAYLLIGSFFPDDSQETDNHFHRTIRSRVESFNILSTIDDYHFAEYEVSQIVLQQNHTKAPREDGFNAAIVKALHSADPNFLTKLYNKCITLSFS